MDERASKMSNAFAAIVLAASACSPTSEPIAPFVGRATRAVQSSSAAPKPPDPPVRWERWAELASYRVAVQRTPSQHLAADHEAETLANDAAAAYPDIGPARHPAPGSVLVQRLYAPGAAAPEVLFAMVKRTPAGSAEATWEYLVLDPAGFVTERGAIETCARCHAEAPDDGVFGRAR